MKISAEIRNREEERLALAFRNYTLAQLRWDWGCNIDPDTRALIVAELNRRKVTREQFETLGRGQRKEC